MNDTVLLSQYAQRRCRASFETLCERYADLVYVLTRTGGDHFLHLTQRGQHQVYQLSPK